MLSTARKDELAKKFNKNLTPHKLGFRGSRNCQHYVLRVRQVSERLEIILKIMKKKKQTRNAGDFLFAF